MKTPRPRFLPLLLAALCFSEPAHARDESQPEIIPADTAAATAGEKAAAALAARLSSSLIAALAEGGPVSAVEFCHTRALPLTAQRGPDSPGVLGLKRTSLRVRNPANSPDHAENQALDYTAALIARGGQPGTLAQRVPGTNGGEDELRIYRPIFVQAACLACHGTLDAQPATLRAALSSRYPNDAAHGYRSGEWRGLIRVTLASHTFGSGIDAHARSADPSRPARPDTQSQPIKTKPPATP